MVMHEWLSCAATSNALKLNQGSSLPFCLIVSAPKKGAWHLRFRGEGENDHRGKLGGWIGWRCGVRPDVRRLRPFPTLLPPLTKRRANGSSIFPPFLLHGNHVVVLQSLGPCSPTT